MNSEQYARIKELFARARELRVDERAAYLDRECGEDEALRTEVEELLEADEAHSGDAFDRVFSTDEELVGDAVLSRPRRIGKYRILSVCGSGGMGTVYEAEQDSPLRRVALKVIQAAAPRPDLLRRFRRETEILARLQHPGIAQIFEAGEFEQDGVRRPFFAMEFVAGAPLLDFANQHALDVAARLDIFVRICDAMHYAHQQGVVHRDLKPDNIFVVESGSSGSTTQTTSSTQGQPKILDFGVAGLTDPEAQVTMATGAGQLLGSVPYMSPEQATGQIDRIDARSDVYSLGVVLFELLIGRLPYAVKHRPLADALHAIRYDEPSRLGSADPGLRGDLETIVSKCLEKDRDRRYESAGALAEDVRRYRELKPIAARAPSTWYQLRKFTQRNRVLVGGAVTTFLAILVGAVVSAVLAVDATRSAEDAREARERSDRAAYRAKLSAASALFEDSPAHARRTLDEVPEAFRGWEWHLLSSTLASFLLEFGEVDGPVPHRFENMPDHDMHLLAAGEEVVALAAHDEFRVWRTRTGDVLRTLDAPGSVGAFAAARDGSLLAAALTDGRVVTCDPRADEAAWTTWHEDEALVDALAVGPAGNAIAIDRPGELRFGAPGAWHVHELAERNPSVTPPALEFSRDGTRLAVQSDTVLLYDVATGAQVGEPLDGHQGNWAVAIAPDLRRVALGQMRRELRFLEVASGEIDYELLGHNHAISDVAYSESGERLVSVSTLGGTIRVWDLEEREQLAVFDAPDTARAEFLDDDHVLSLTNGRFRLWTLRDRRSREMPGQLGHVFGAAFSGDGELVVASAPWGDMAVWDTLGGEPLYRTKAEHRTLFAFDAAGEHLHVHGFTALPWYGGPEVPLDVPLRQRLHHSWHNEQLELRLQGAAMPLPMDGLRVFRTEHAPQPDGGQLRAFIDGEELELSGTQLAPDLGPHPQLRVGSLPFGGKLVELVVIEGRLTDGDALALDAYLAARRDGRDGAPPRLDGLLVHFRAEDATVVRSDDGQVQRWIASNDADRALELRGGPRVISFVPASEERPAHLQFNQGYGVMQWLEMPLPRARSAEALTVCWVGEHHNVSTPPWNTPRTAYSIETVDVPWRDRDERIVKPGPVQAFSVDGRYLARVVPDLGVGGAVVVRDVETGHGLANFAVDDHHYYGVSFHPDSRRLACGAKDGTIDVYDVETGQLLERIEAHDSICFDVAYSPDGTLLASAGNDNALRLWDTQTYESLLELPGHRSYVRCINWSPDGTRLGSGDYTVRIWDTTPRDERYAQLLAQRVVEDSVRVQVEELYAAHEGDREAVARELRRRFADDPTRRRAGLRVLARVEADED